MARLIKHLVSYLVLAALSWNITVQALHIHRYTSDRDSCLTISTLKTKLLLKCSICEYLAIHNGKQILPETLPFGYFPLLLCDISAQADYLLLTSFKISPDNKGPPYKS